MNNLNRRDVLRLMGTGPLVYGLSSAIAELIGAAEPRETAEPQDPSQPGQPKWLDAAIERASRTQTPLAAFVVPDQLEREAHDPAKAAEKKQFEAQLLELLRNRPDAEWRIPEGGQLPGKISRMISWTLPFEHPPSRFLVHVQLLLESQRYEVMELIMEATWVCLRRDQIGAAAGENVVLLDGKGRRAAGVMVDLSDPAEFATRVRHLLRGNGQAERRAQAAITPATDRALRQLSSATPAERAAAKQLLIKRFDRHRAAILEAHTRFADATMRAGIREVVTSAHQRARAPGMTGPLPFGAEVADRAVYDPCPPCGMARVPAASRKLLSFLAYK